MSKTGLWIIVAIFLVTILALVYLAFNFEAPEGTTTVTLPNPSQQEEATPDPASRTAAPSTPSLPTIRIEPNQEPATAQAVPDIAPPPAEVVNAEPEPVPESEVVETELVQLPALNNSDNFVREQIRGLSQGAAILQRLTEEQMLRRFVVLVDNISRDTFPQTDLPYETPEGEMPVRTIDDNLFLMGDEAYARFDAAMETFVAIDTDAAMALYRTLSPLFQQAYAELGYGNAEFDNTLRRAINNVLETSEIEGPFQLVKPSVMFVYADARIENLSDVQKQMLRLGPENASALKAKLREFMQAL